MENQEILANVKRELDGYFQWEAEMNNRTIAGEAGRELLELRQQHAKIAVDAIRRLVS